LRKRRAISFAIQKAKNTIRGHGCDWKPFTAWCEAHRLEFLPATPATVTLYLSDMAAKRKASTLTRHLSAIAQAHQIAGLEFAHDVRPGTFL